MYFICIYASVTLTDNIVYDEVILVLVYCRTPTSCPPYEGHLGQETDPIVKILMWLHRKIMLPSELLFSQP